MTATLGNGRGLRELAPGVLERDGGIGRERSTRGPGSVPYVGQGTNRGDSVGGGLDMQGGFIHWEVISRCVRLWMPRGFNGPS